MGPPLVFFVAAVLLGCLILAIVRVRLRAVARQPNVTDDDLCELEQASRITSILVVVSLIGLVAAALGYLIVRAG